MGFGLRTSALYVGGDGAPEVYRDARLEVEAGGASEVFRDARLPVDARATVYRDARIPIEARSTVVAVQRDARLSVEATATLFRDARIPVEAGTSIIEIYRDARIPVDAGAHGTGLQGYMWQVRQPADFVQAYTWTVVAVATDGAVQRYRWHVYREDLGQAYTWTIIPAELLELFDSEGVGAAAGIASDVLLPVGRVTKD